MTDPQQTDPRTAPTAGPEDEVLAAVGDGVGILTLNRPRAINALSPAMITTIAGRLEAWQADAGIERIELRGAGERGFCSGADVRAIRQLVLDEPEAAVRFFVDEYRLDAAIAHSTTPVTARLQGISMGGGLGLALHAQRVVATPDLQLAMPETGIGLFPDVGVTHLLARAPGECGTWMALTGTTIDAGSAVFAGLVDEIEGLDDAATRALAEGSALATDRTWIDECFTGDDADEIVRRLEAHPQARARECAALVRSRSPWSVAVALEAVRRAATMSLDEVLAQDLALAHNFVADSDFVEGVRAQLVDKDRDPHWRHAGLAEVPRELVESMFRA